MEILYKSLYDQYSLKGYDSESYYYVCVSNGFGQCTIEVNVKKHKQFKSIIHGILEGALYMKFESYDF